MNDPWVCQFGYHHAVPSLAVTCTGAMHGLAPGQDDEEVG